MKKLDIFIIFLLFYSNVLLGYDWKECKKFYKEEPVSLFFGVALFSTTQFSSSWGRCSMIGSNDEKKKIFIAMNEVDFKNDSARGGGEYLSAYARLSGCNKEAEEIFTKLLQKNYVDIYGMNNEKSPEAIYESIERIMYSDSMARNSCKVKS